MKLKRTKTVPFLDHPVNAGLELGTQGLGLRTYGLGGLAWLSSLALTLRPKPRPNPILYLSLY